MELIEIKNKVDKYLGQEVSYLIIGQDTIYRESGILQKNEIIKDLCLSFIGQDKNTQFCVNSEIITISNNSQLIIDLE
jgi:hypothetical protein